MNDIKFTYNELNQLYDFCEDSIEHLIAVTGQP